MDENTGCCLAVVAIALGLGWGIQGAAGCAARQSDNHAAVNMQENALDYAREQDAINKYNIQYEEKKGSYGFAPTPLPNFEEPNRD